MIEKFKQQSKTEVNIKWAKN